MISVLGLITNSVTASLLATRVNGDMLFLNARSSFLDTVRRAPKAPLVFGVYSSGRYVYASGDGIFLW